MNRRLHILGALLALLLLAPITTEAQEQSWKPAGPGGGGALFLPSINPLNVGEIYIACDMSELFHTSNAQSGWGQVSFKQIQVSGTLGRVEFTSSNSTRYALTNTGEIPHGVRTTDGGNTWSDLPSDPTGGGAFNLFADPGNTTRLLMTDYTTLFVSTDGGTTWAQRYTNNDGSGLHIGGAFFDGNTIYLGTNVGLLVSSDGGASFAKSNAAGIPAGETIVSMAGGKSGNVTRLLAVTLGTADVYAGITGADHGSYRGVYTLDVGGASWVSRGAGIPAGVEPFFAGMARTDASVLYVAGGGSDGAPTVYKSTNGGGAWVNNLITDNNGNVATGWSGHQGDRAWSYGEYALGFAVAPSDPNTAVITDLGFAHMTADGGSSWRQVYVAEADANAAGSPTPQGKAYHSNGIENTTAWQVAWADSAHMFGCYSDIRGTISTDAGATWGFGYTGHTNNSMYRIAVHPGTGVMYGATSSVHDMYQSTTLTDARINGGRGTVVFSSNKGQTWQLLHDFQHPVVWVALDSAHPNRLYAAVAHSTLGGIYVSNDIQNGAASQWAKLTNPPRTEGHPFNIQVLRDGMLVCTYSGRRTTAFTNSSGLFTSTDGGTTWQDRSSPQMLYWTKDVVIDPHDATQNTWYVGVFSGWGGAPNGLGGLYRTTDRGITWKKILDQDRVTSCAVSPTDPNEMYATTETAGLWYSKNATASTPTFASVDGYPFRQPERVFYDPYVKGRIWATSFGNGLRYAAPAPPLVAPQLLLPTNDTVGITSTYLFTWRPAGSTYRMQVASTEDFSSGIIFDSSGIVPTAALVSGMPVGVRLYWRVRAATNGGETPWSEVWHFTTATPKPLAKPTLVAPANDTVRVPIPYYFRWNDVPDAVSYQFQLATAPTFGSVLDNTVLNATSTYHAVGGLALATKYYWRVRAINYLDTSAWSDTWNFTTRDSVAVLVAPSLVSPANLAADVTVGTLLIWNPLEAAVSYELNLATQADFSDSTVGRSSDTSIRASKILAGTTYYWRVRGIGGPGPGPWSETWRFTTAPLGSVDARGRAAGARLRVLSGMPTTADAPITFSFQLPHSGSARLAIVDAIGRPVATLADGTFEAGEQQARWAPQGVPSGIYFCTLICDGNSAIERVVVVR